MRRDKYHKEKARRRNSMRVDIQRTRQIHTFVIPFAVSLPQKVELTQVVLKGGQVTLMQETSLSNPPTIASSENSSEMIHMKVK